MSILIKGMEMPKNCYGCPFFKQVDYWNKNDEADILSKCKRTGEFTWESVNGYLPNCPLVPVPPHYDLIDHNALKIAVMDCDAETRIDFLKHAMDCINKAPVVIPSDMPTYEAEEGET